MMVSRNFYAISEIGNLVVSLSLLFSLIYPLQSLLKTLSTQLIIVLKEQVFSIVHAMCVARVLILSNLNYKAFFKFWVFISIDPLVVVRAWFGRLVFVWQAKSNVGPFRDTAAISRVLCQQQFFFLYHQQKKTSALSHQLAGILCMRHVQIRT